MNFLETMADPATLNVEQLAISMAGLLTMALFALIVLDITSATWTKYPRRWARYTVAHARSMGWRFRAFVPRFMGFSLIALAIAGVATTARASLNGTTPPLARLVALATN